MADSSSASSAPACSSRIPIVPVRYAVLPGAPGAKAYAYAGSGFALDQSLPALKEATYTLRALRPGYVYVYMKGTKGEKLVIHEYDGQGKFRELTYTGLENYHRRDAYRGGGATYWVWADTCSDYGAEVWIGYSTHLWTNATTTNVMGSEAMRRRLMRPLDVHELTNGAKKPSAQKHVLPATALSTWVEDYKPKQQRVPLAWSTWAVKEELPLQIILAQAANYPATQPRVPAAVALYDAEGTSLDLGLVAAAHQHQIVDIQNAALQKQDPSQPSSEPLPACVKLDVDKLYAASADFQRKNITALLLDRTLRSIYVGGDTPTSRNPDKLAALRSEGYRAQSGERFAPTDTEVQYQVLTDKNLSPGGARLAKRIDPAKYKAFLAEREKSDQQIKQLLQRMDAACANHDSWLATAELNHSEKPFAIAAALTAYDRNNLSSAQGLEQSIALIMHGMGYPLPGRDDKDPRFARLQAWVTNPKNSPAFMAVAAYNPFSDRADAVGGLLAASDVLLEELHGRFPAASNSTDLIAQDVTTVVLKRMNGKTRWDASKSLRQQVVAAAKDADAEKILGLLSARYGIAKEGTVTTKFTEEVETFIRSGMVAVKKSSTVEVAGTRAVTVLETTTARVVPSIKSLNIIAGGGAINMLMLHFNIINLQSAWNDLQSQPQTQQIANFGSAVMGTIAATAATVVSARSFYVALAARMAVNLPGASFGAGLTGMLTSKLFGRVTGYVGIVLGIIADGSKGYTQYKAGNAGAGAYTASGGFLIGVGSGAMLEGGIALGSAMATVFSAAAAEATVPVAGWIGAVVTILVGAAVVGTGVWLQSKATEQKHSPLELWAARSVFGTRQNDGETRDGIKLDTQKHLPGYAGVRAEVQGWYEGYFAPLPLSQDQVNSLGLDGMATQWHGHWFSADSAELAVLLPGFVVGQSQWDGDLRVPPRPGERLPLAEFDQSSAQVFDTSNGLLLYFNKTLAAGDAIELNVTYYPNQGFEPASKVTASVPVVKPLFNY